MEGGFGVEKEELVVMGEKYESLDVYEYGGWKVKEKVERYVKKGNIWGIV